MSGTGGGRDLSREELLATTLVELADTLDDKYDVLQSLQTLVVRSTEILGATAAGVSLVDLRGALHLVASTTHAAGARPLIEMAASRGLGAEAFSSGKSLINLPAPSVARRWPEFTTAAEALGFRSAQVTPLRLRNEVLGVLALLFESDTQLSTADVTILEALAQVTTIGLLRERTPRQKELLAEQLQTAAQLRTVVEQAKGVLAELLGVDTAQAFDILRRFADREGQALSEVCVAVLEGRLGTAHLRHEN